MNFITNIIHARNAAKPDRENTMPDQGLTPSGYEDKTKYKANTEISLTHTGLGLYGRLGLTHEGSTNHTKMSITKNTQTDNKIFIDKNTQTDDTKDRIIVMLETIINNQTIIIDTLKEIKKNLCRLIIDSIYTLIYSIPFTLDGLDLCPITLMGQAHSIKNEPQGKTRNPERDEPLFGSL